MHRPRATDEASGVAERPVALLVLLAVVAFASRTGFGHASNTTPTPSYVNWAMSVVLVVLVAMTPVAIWAYGPPNPREARTRGAAQLPDARDPAASRSCSCCRLLLGPGYLRNHLHFGTRGLTTCSSETAMLRVAVSTARGRRLQGRPSNGLSFGRRSSPGRGGGRLVLVAQDARLSPPMSDAATMETDIAASISDAIDDLESEPDARRAVIAGVRAHGRCLAATASGAKRADRDEYLQRILLGLTDARRGSRALDRSVRAAKSATIRSIAG